MNLESTSNQSATESGFYLPNRKLGAAKKAGWLILLAAFVGTLLMVSWIAMPVGWGISIMMKGEMLGALFIAFGCLGLGGLYGVAKLMALGIAVLKDRTRCSISVEEKRMLCREHFGWFSHKRSIGRESIEQLYLAPVGAMSSSQSERSENRSGIAMLDSVLGSDLASLYTIVTQKQNGKRIATGYSKEVLDATASAIASEINRNRTDSVHINRSEFSEVDVPDRGLVLVQELTEENAQTSDYVLPDDSQIEVVEESDSKVYRIPERPLMKGSGGLFLFSVMWNSILVIITMCFFFLGGNGMDWGAVPVILIFWAIGIGFLVGSIYMARQSALIGVKDGLLFIERKTIFGTKWTEFAAEEIESVEMAYANMEINNVRVMNLRIQAADQKPVSMLAHLSNPELQWLAHQLRRSLGVNSKQNRLNLGSFSPEDTVEVPPATDIDVQHDSSRTTITVPPREFSGAKTLWLLGTTLAIVPIPAAIAAMFFVGFGLDQFCFAVFASIVGATMYFVHRFITSRNFLIEVTNRELDVKVRGFMTNHGLSATRDELESINVVDADLQLNGRSLYCVQIKVKNGKSFMMMTGRDQKELVYVAGLIHQKLRSSVSDSSN